MIILLAIAVTRTNYGVWNADIPLGDESWYIEQSFRLFEQGKISLNLYFDAYIAYFNFVGTDPIAAHCCVRFFSSLYSVIMLFLFLSSVRGISHFGAYVMSLFWNLNLLNTPIIQFGNINLFTFALACTAGYMWLSKAARYTRPIAVVILLAAIVIRHEYSILLSILLIHQLLSWLKRGEADNSPGRAQAFYKALAFFISTALVAIVLFPGAKSGVARLFNYVDGYLFLGLKQCYTAFTVAGNPALHLEPYTEFDLLMNRKFPSATGFFSALWINPFEVLKYFFLNGISNLSHIYYMLPSHSVLLPSGLVTNGLTGGHTTGDFVAKKFAGYSILWFDQLLNVLFIGFGSGWFLLTKRAELSPKRLWANDSYLFIVGAAAVATISILLHIPDPRYWIMVLPLIYLGSATLVSHYCAGRSNGMLAMLTIFLPFVFVNPVFTSTLNYTPDTNQSVALALRGKLGTIPPNEPIRALGFYPSPLLSFSIPGRWESTNNIDVRNGKSYEGLVESRRYDLVIIDGFLRKTDQYAKEKPFFDKLLQQPESFGYKVLLTGSKRDGPICILRKT